eukprot:1413096-Prymnesium_polylepis.1
MRATRHAPRPEQWDHMRHLAAKTAPTVHAALLGAARGMGSDRHEATAASDASAGPSLRAVAPAHDAVGGGHPSAHGAKAAGGERRRPVEALEARMQRVMDELRDLVEKQGARIDALERRVAVGRPERTAAPAGASGRGAARPSAQWRMGLG